MSLFARALAGAGEGAATVAGKYLDTQLTMQKAQALEELRIMGEQRLDEYRNSPERRERLRSEALKDDQAKFEQGVQQTISEAGNAELRRAKIDQTNAITEGTAPAKANAEALLTRAKSRNTAQVLAPGQVVTIDGQPIGENTRPTPAEVSLTAWRAGFKGDKMSEAGKVQLGALEQRATHLQQLIDKGVADGTLSTHETGADGKPAPGFANLQYLKTQQQAIGLQRMRLLASEGALDGKEAAEQLMAIGPTGADLEASIAQADRIGSAYARDFRAALEPALKIARSRDYMLKSIQADAEKTGTKNYTVDIDGVRSYVGDANAAKAASAASKNGRGAPETPEVVEIKRLEESVKQAQSELGKWGSRQRQTDPRGFARAQQAVVDARTAMRDAIDRMGIPEGTGSAAFRTANP